MLRVVIDTSTLVSFALTAGDITRQIIGAWRAEEFTLLTTPATRDELTGYQRRLTSFRPTYPVI